MHHQNNQDEIKLRIEDAVMCQKELNVMKDIRVHLVLYLFGGGHVVKSD
jgi:hypothetical protein